MVKNNVEEMLRYTLYAFEAVIRPYRCSFQVMELLWARVLCSTISICSMVGLIHHYLLELIF